MMFPRPGFRSLLIVAALIPGASMARSDVSGPNGLVVATTTSLPSMLPDSIRPGERDYLEPNVPNPAHVGKTVKIGFSIRQDSRVIIRLYDCFYDEVTTIVDDMKAAGHHDAFFTPPPSMPSGFYFYEMRAGDYYEIRRMMYVR